MSARTSRTRSRTSSSHHQLIQASGSVSPPDVAVGGSVAVGIGTGVSVGKSVGAGEGRVVGVGWAVGGVPGCAAAAVGGGVGGIMTTR